MCKAHFRLFKHLHWACSVLHALSMPLAKIGQRSRVSLQNGSVAKVKELVDILNNGEGLTTSVDITDIVGMRLSLTSESFFRQCEL